jgi:prepilin-type N-terminal cleavage/methylation domain-containing protein
MTHKPPVRPRFRPAFTLIEILCVVVILGIAAAIVVPQVGNRDDLNVSAAARTVLADLIYAQNLAISSQQTVYVAFDTVGQTYCITTTPPASVPPAFNLAVTNPTTGMNYVGYFYTPTAAAGQAPEVIPSSTLTSANFSGTTVLAFMDTGTPQSFSTSTRVGTNLTTSGAITVTSGVCSLTIYIEPGTGEMTVQ